MNNDLEDLKVYQYYVDLYYYVYNITQKYPKQEKYALVSDIKSVMRKGLEQIIKAQKTHITSERIKYYARYMDDFMILLPTKEECKIVLEKIKNFIKENLVLELNHKTRYYPSKFGVNFCGYIIHEKYMLLRKSCIKKIKRKQKEGNLKIENYNGHLKHSNCFNFLNKTLKLK